MRILFKVLLFPLTFILTMFVTVSMFLVERCAAILNIFSGIMFFAALIAYMQYLFGWPVGVAGSSSTLHLTIFGTVLAFILSPYGLPLLAMWLISKLNDLNGVIKSL